MTDRAILFSGPMVRAILDGRKTVTRRVVKPQPPSPESIRARAGIDFGLFTDDGSGVFRVSGPVWAVREEMDLPTASSPRWTCPYGQPGDRLWVRETHWIGSDGVCYRADGEMPPHMDGVPWRPSIHMPRWASRITLEVEDVRVERLQAIDNRDAIMEGCGAKMALEPVTEFARGWDSLNAKRGYSWESNPWVWRIAFHIADTNNDKE